MRIDIVLEDIGRELSAAGSALAGGNEGKARVCARRAAGKAIGWRLSQSDNKPPTGDAVALLRELSRDAAVPGDVRDAAGRLSSRISGDFSYAPPFSALNDARAIVAFCVPQEGGNDVR